MYRIFWTLLLKVIFIVKKTYQKLLQILKTIFLLRLNIKIGQLLSVGKMANMFGTRGKSWLDPIFFVSLGLIHMVTGAFVYETERFSSGHETLKKNNLLIGKEEQEIMVKTRILS
jgi:hypothetical protein